MLQDEAPLPLLFCGELLELDPGFLPPGSGAECSLLPQGITGVKDGLNEGNLVA